MLLLVVGVLVSSCHRTPPPPGLAAALRVEGEATERVRGFLEVALRGRDGERERAWFLAGLYACDAGAPLPASAYFARAHASGGLATLATRRLEDSLADAPLWGGQLRALTSAPFIATEDASRLQLRAAETLLRQQRPQEAVAALPPLERLGREHLRRALAVLAGARPAERATLARRVLIEVPRDFSRLFPGESEAAIERGFTVADWARHAQAWLDLGEPARAARAGQRGGAEGALVAARALVRLRKGTEALPFTIRAGSSLEALIERAEAFRLMAWGSEPPNRAARFADMLRTAREASRMTSAGSGEQARVAVQLAEALTELGKLEQAATALGTPGCPTQARFDWVLRRWHLLAARARVDPGLAPQGSGSRRVQRVAEYWRAARAARGGDRRGLEALAQGGLSDLPAIWASAGLARPLPAIVLSAGIAPSPAPPPWSRELADLGRTTDIAVAWRADLEAGRVDASGWLGLAALTKLPPIETIPLLVRGEPRLLAGPWEGLPVALLQQYLPLLYRAELESAARRAGVPPWVLAGVVRQESAFNPRARSAADALGLAQVLLPVGREAGARLGIRISSEADLLDPSKNLAAGAWLLASWRRSFDGAWTPAIASYNAGERRIRKVWQAAGSREGPEFVEAIELPETWDYVHRVVFLAEGYRLVYWPEGRPFPWT